MERATVCGSCLGPLEATVCRRGNDRGVVCTGGDDTAASKGKSSQGARPTSPEGAIGFVLNSSAYEIRGRVRWASGPAEVDG